MLPVFFIQQRRLIAATIRFFDLFSGIGGFREGLRRASGFTCVGHCEVDAYADKNYRLLFDTEGEWFCNDARTIETERMPDFDLLCAGFPCQAFSIAGKREGFADARGTLFFEIARLVADKRPAYFILENVPGLLSHDKGRTFHTILSTLSELGYGVENKVMNLIQKKDLRDDHGELFGFGTHMFRHVYGIRLTEMHLDDWTIAKLLGHTSVKNVKFYRKMSLQIIADETREIRAEMSRMIRANLAGWGKEYEQI